MGSRNIDVMPLKAARKTNLDQMTALMSSVRVTSTSAFSKASNRARVRGVGPPSHSPKAMVAMVPVWAITPGFLITAAIDVDPPITRSRPA